MEIYIYVCVVHKSLCNLIFLQATVMEANNNRDPLHLVEAYFFSLTKINKTGNGVVRMNNNIHTEPYDVVINPCPDFLDNLT